MRLRSTATAVAVGAFALALGLPASANAAEGDFSYRVPSAGGEELYSIGNPPSGQCITLPEAGQDYLPPAHSPRNFTDSRAVVFAGAGCEGPHFGLRPFGGHGSEYLKVRSVLFL